MSARVNTKSWSPLLSRKDMRQQSVRAFGTVLAAGRRAVSATPRGPRATHRTERDPPAESRHLALAQPVGDDVAVQKLSRSHGDFDLVEFSLRRQPDRRGQIRV